MSASPAVLRAESPSTWTYQHLSPHSPAAGALARLEPAAAPAASRPVISLLLERDDTASQFGSAKFTTLSCDPNDSVQSLQLRLKRRNAFQQNHCLVLGDRTLLEHETVGDLAATVTETNSYLHVVIRLADVESVTVNTRLQRNLSFSSDEMPAPIRRSKSALTALLEDSPERASSPCSSLADRQLSPMGRSPSSPTSGIVHLIIHKSAKVGWRHRPGSKLELSISADATAETVAAELEAFNDLPTGQHHLEYKGQVLAPGKSLASYGIQTGHAVLELVPVSTASQSETGSPPLSSPEHELFADWQSAREGLLASSWPQLAGTSSGGTYFVPNAAGEKVAVLKPADEEPYSINNPRVGLGTSPDGHGLRKGIRPGEGAIREVAAYVLDHGHFAGVPPTAMVSCRMPGDTSMAKGTVKVASLQAFVKADTDCEEQGPSAFPVSEVHKISVLDLRLANTDRNGGNILACFVDGKWQLTPIDHGYCLPDSFQDLSFEWMNWHQAHVPFDQGTKDYIAALDAEKDLAALAAHGLHLRSECKRVFRACTMLLKMGAARGLSPYAIGSIMCRESMLKSPLEKLHARTLQLTRGVSAFSVCTYSNSSSPSQNQDNAYLSVLETILQEYLDEIVLDGVAS